MRNTLGQFTNGKPPEKRFEVGATRIRTRHKRGGEQRAYVKISEPNVWVLRSRFVWESAHGPIPNGFSVHHKDRNKLNDDLTNLEIMTLKEHLAEHRLEYAAKISAALTLARRERRWSTKSLTKRNGRPASWTESDMERAVDAYKAGEGNRRQLAKRFAVSYNGLLRRT